LQVTDGMSMGPERAVGRVADHMRHMVVQDEAVKTAVN
jgi:hypothetical protein